MKKERLRAKAPPQVTLGGKVGLAVWRRHVVPLLKKANLSTRATGEKLGVSHTTVARWRSAYL